MNPLTNMKNVTKLSELDLKSGGKGSWHDMYRDSAWIFVGGLPFSLCEGDVICVFSQYGEIVNLNLVRDKITGKSKGFCFVCYEDQRSTILAVDNLNGIKILDRSIRVDHVADYKPPKENDKMDEETLQLYIEGCAPKPVAAAPQEPSSLDVKPKIEYNSDEEHTRKDSKKKKKKKHKKEKKAKSKKSKRSKHSSSSSASESD